MTVSFVAAASVEATSLTMPSHQAGDLLVMYAFNNTGTTLPTVPSGWTLITSRSANSKGGVVCVKQAASISEVSGTWTNASFLACAAYRDDIYMLAIGNFSQTGTAGATNPTWGTIQTRAGGSWVIGIVGLSLNTEIGETPPTGMTNRTNTAGASSGEVSIHDTNAATTWSSQSITTAALTYQTFTLEILSTLKPKGVPSIGRGSMVRGAA